MRLLIPDEQASEGDGTESEAESSKASAPKGKDPGIDGSKGDDASSATENPASQEGKSQSPSIVVSSPGASPGLKKDGNSSDSNSSSSSGPWVILLLVAGGASCTAICTVTVMHAQGILQDGSRGIVTNEKLPLRKGRVRRRSSQVNELTRLREQDEMASDNDAEFETV